jgi:hypothetical protein
VNTSSIARATGLILGLTLALGLLLSGHVPQGSAQAPARVSLVPEPAVQLGVSPVGRDILHHSTLTPGAPSVSGVVAVSNLTDAGLEARPRLSSREPAVDNVVRVALTAGRTRVYSGTLAGLRSASTAKLRLAANETSRVRIRLSVPASAARVVKGRSVELKLDWRPRRVGR